MSVVGQLDVGGQGSIDLRMSADVMTGMNEPGLPRPYPLCKGHSLVEGLVGVMGCDSQGVDDECVDVVAVGQLVVSDGLHVGDVGKGLSLKFEV